MTGPIPIAPLLFLCAACAAGQRNAPIVLDGRFDDWEGVAVAVDDPADSPESEVDFGPTRIAAGGRSLCLLIDVGAELNVQRLEGTIRIPLDADGDARTGQTVEELPGADLVIELTPPDPEGGRGRGVGLVVDGAPAPVSPYDVNLSFSPTHSSRLVELCLDRGAELRPGRPILAGTRVRGRLVYADRDGQVLDRTAPFVSALPLLDLRQREQPADPLARRGVPALRVASWNVEFASLFRTPELHGRILAAIDPDVILFQELTNRTTAAELDAFLARAFPARRFRVILGEGGGDLRTAVAGPEGLTPVEGLAVVPYPDLPGRSIRIAAGSLLHRGRRLLLASVHLTCCGSSGTFEDRTRQVEADGIRRAIAGVLAADAFDGVVIAGDLNLVGSRRPLDLLGDGLDPEGGALLAAETLQLDGRTNATWSAPGQPFTPGRLDFVLYSGSALEINGAFPLDTTDLLPRWLSSHGLQAGDIGAASDHLPVVVDLRYR